MVVGGGGGLFQKINHCNISGYLDGVNVKLCRDDACTVSTCVYAIYECEYSV